MRKLLLASVASMGLVAAAGVANAQPAKAPAPGTISVHLNGYLMYNMVDYGATGMSVQGGTKHSPVATSGDVRLYPGFDAQTTTGIQYGAQIELRTTTNSTSYGKGVSSNTSTGSDSLYVRRAYGYIGNAESGFVRFGQTDSVFGLLQDGVIENFGDGNGWNSDGGVADAISSGKPGQFIFADTGNLYTTDKIVYFTPAFQDPILGGKLSAGAGYEPNSNGIKEGVGSGENISSQPGGDTASSGGGLQRQNTVDVMAQYAVNLDGFANKISAGYIVGSPQGNTTGAQLYNELSVFQVGAQTTTMGLTVGANVKAGSTDDSYSLKPKGGRNALDYIAGASYAMGPWIVGGSFFDGQSATGWSVANHTTTARTRSEYGVAAGVTYQVAKPMAVYVQYLYGHEHQPTATTKGNSQAQAVGVGALLKW